VSVVANVAINVDSRGAVGQLKAVQQGAVATDKAVDKLNATTAAVEGKFKVAANGVKYFTDATGRARAENGRFLSSTERAAAGLQAQGRAAEQAAAKMRGLNGAMEQLQGAMAVAGPYIALAAGIAAAAGASLKFSNEIDRNRQQLTLFTKNVEATNAIIADLKTTADATSLGLPGLLEATKTLAAYGVTAKNAGTATKLLGDLALGDNEKLQRFAVNLGQISSIGRAYTVDLKQFAMAGIPIFEALAKVMGTSTSEVLRLAEQGKVTYPIVIKAINELTKEGASFYNGAEEGGTNLDRSLAQLQGSFESLQVVIGNAVGPTAVTGVTILKDALDGVLLVVKYLSNEFEYFSGLISKSDFGHTIINELKFVTKYLQENPDLMMALNPGTKVLGPVGEFLGPLGKIAQNQKKEDKKTGKKTDPTQLLNEANAIAEKNAITELANLRIENNNKIAKINKNTELQLKDNRLQYEQQIADFRVSTLRRIADMERDLEDQRVKANFDLQQAQLKLAGSRQFIGQTQDISRAIVGGKSPAEIQSLQTARDSAKTLNDAAVTRRQIEFDSTMKKIQLERTLTDFKRGIEREIGEMQKNYARQVAGILQTAGRTLSDLMVEGAKKAKEIMESAKPTGGAGGAGATVKGVFDTGLRTGPSNVIGGSAAYHQDLSFGPTVDLEQKRKLLIQLAEGYDKLGKKIELSNAGVAGRVFPLKGTVTEQNKFITDAEAAHKARGGGTGRTAIDFYTPDKNQNRFGPSVENTAMYAPIVPGGEKKYQSGGGGGASIRAMKDGKLIYELMHGATNRFLPQSGKMPQLPQAQTQTLAQAGAAAMQAPVGSRAMQVDAANNIKPFSPATAKLDQQTKGLIELNNQTAITEKINLQNEYTKSLAESTGTVLQQSKANLDTAIQKNQLDQKTLDLIIGGTNPALAAQFAQNEQLVAQNKLMLVDQIKKIEGSLQETDLTAEQVNLRMQDVDLLNQQIAAGPQILENLNQQAIKQKEISDATARRSVIPNFIGSAQTQLKDLESVAVRVSQGIGDAVGNSLTKGVQGLIEGTTTAQQVFADFLKSVGDILMQEGAKMIATYTAIAIARSLAGLFGGGGGLPSFGDGGGFGSFEGGALGTASGGLGGGDFTSFLPGKSFYKAAGGPVSSNSTYMVGEKGPELFVPSAAGTIIPAGPTAGIREAMANGNGQSNASPVLNMSFESSTINGVEYVSRDQLETAMMETRRQASRDGAKRGMTMTLDRLQQSPSTRSRIGLG